MSDIKLPDEFHSDLNVFNDEGADIAIESDYEGGNSRICLSKSHLPLIIQWLQAHSQEPPDERG